MRSASRRRQLSVTVLVLLLAGLQSPAGAEDLTFRAVPYAQATLALSGTVSEMRVRVGDKSLHATGVRNLRISYRVAGGFEPPTISAASTCPYGDPTVSHAARLAAKSGGRTKAHFTVSYWITSSDGRTLVQRDVRLLGEDGVTLGDAGTPEALPVEICVLGGEPVPPAFETGVAYAVDQTIQASTAGVRVAGVEVQKISNPRVVVSFEVHPNLIGVSREQFEAGKNPDDPGCAVDHDPAQNTLNTTIVAGLRAGATGTRRILVEYTETHDGGATVHTHPAYSSTEAIGPVSFGGETQRVPLCVF